MLPPSPKRIGQYQYPRCIFRFHHKQPKQCFDFFQKSSFLRLTGSTTSSPEKDDDAPALDSWTGLPSLSVEETGRNYSSATPSLPHRQRHQENQAVEKPCSSGKI
jgi:hypothetical protein